MAGLTAENITHDWGARRALDDVSFSVERGRFCALLGHNGAGKSTLFGILTRLFTARAGRVIIAGQDLQRYPRHALARMGVVFQASTLDLDLTVRRAGFHAALGVSITPPYQTYITSEIYIVPGLVGMILLFNGMQLSLGLVYDREMGSIRLLLTAPLPRWWLLFCRLVAGNLMSVLQAYAFLLVAGLYKIRFPVLGFVAAVPAITIAAMMLGALGLMLSSFIRQLENFAGVIAFVIFPMFFLSSALYPLWKVAEASPWLHDLCALNPFTHAVELVRFALYAESNGVSLALTTGAFAVFGLGAVWGYDPTRGLAARKA